MRKLIYYIATSLDGFIAHEDGSFDGFSWNEEFIAHLLSEYPETIPAHLKDETGSKEQNKLFDTVLMGRKTYNVGLQQGITNPYPTLDQYLFSRTLKESPDQNITLVQENAIEAVQSLKNNPGKAIWLCGGSELATQFLAANLIDQFIIKLNPVVFGSGIPLISGIDEFRALKLTDCKDFKSGHLILTYDVGKFQTQNL
jgi:dihydrofolate reductase